MANNWTGTGRLGKDPEYKEVGSKNTPLCTFSMATDGWRKDDDPDWHRITVWGNQAGPCSKYLKKGSKVYVEGAVRNNNWEDSEGVSHRSYQIDARRVEFLDSKTRDGGEQGGGHFDDDDVPF